MNAAALLPALALIAATGTAIDLETSARALLWLPPALLAAAAVAWLLRWSRATVVIITIAFACCGFLLGAQARDAALHTALRAAFDRGLDRQLVPTRFVLTEDAASTVDYVALRARVAAVRVDGTWMPADGGVVLTVSGTASREDVNQWRRGRLLEAPVTFRRPARFLNDGVADFERDAALDGISLLGSIKSGLLVAVVQHASFAGERAADVRAYVRRAIARHVAPRGALSAAIVSAVLIGDRSGLPDDVRDRLQAAGTYHVIAISGGNIAIFTGLLVVLLLPIGLHGRAGACATLLLLLAYAALVTAGPSVWRATLVAAGYLVARALDHRSAPWQAMAVAGLLLAVMVPLDVRDAGFVLTFGATAALLEVARRTANRFGWLVTSVAASAAVELALLPVMAATFSRITIAGLLLNLVAVPAMAVVQIAGLVVVCAGPLDAIASITGGIAHLGARAIVDSARLVDAVPWLAWRVPAPTTLTIAIYYAGLALALVGRRVAARIIGCLLLTAAALAIVTGIGVGRDVDGLRLTVFDVGQGEAMALQSPGRRLMIDTGGSPFGGAGFDIGARVLEPALWRRGIASLDTLLLTHGDPDHIGGALPLIDDFDPKTLWQGIPVRRATGLNALLARASASHVPIEERRQGEEFRLGAARIVVLHPSPPDWERQRVRNDDSVVLEVIYGDVALLLTGDIGSEVERDIISHLVPAKTRILKVAHHGSRTSTSQALLEAWRPQMALISCGRANPFGHPAPEVIARLEAIGARIYRTDRDGQITVDTDGDSVFVRTFTGETP